MTVAGLSAAGVLFGFCATVLGLQAQHRFGARTGAAPLMFGIVLLLLGLRFADDAAALFATIPAGAVGALLLVAGSDLALSRRLAIRTAFGKTGGMFHRQDGMRAVGSAACQRR
jgi:MFS superfamily sulfate permease-like transporter